jgi:hypothetical protein
VEQEAGERRTLDLDVLGARLAALLEQDHEQGDEADPEPDGQDLTERAVVDLDHGLNNSTASTAATIAIGTE